MNDVTVVLVTYNSAAVIGAAIESACAEAARVIVVDNASRDALEAALGPYGQKVALLRNSANMGFGRAANRGLADVATPYALLLNPDARLAPGALVALLDTMARWEDAAIAAPLIAKPDGAYQASYKKSVFSREKVGGRFVVPEGECCAEFLSGAVWLIRMQAWREIGGFDENLFLYYEDDDVALRAREKGYALVINPAAMAVHAMGKSSAPSRAGEAVKQYHLAWSRLYMERKYRGKKAALRLRCRMAALYGAKCLGAVLIANPRRLRRAWHRLRGCIT